MPKFRKKPLDIEAVQWDGTTEGATPIIDWILSSDGTATYRCSNPDRCAETDGDTPHDIQIHTLEGAMTASVGDWIIRGVQGEFYPCKPDIFAASYDSVEEIHAQTERFIRDVAGADEEWAASLRQLFREHNRL